MGLQLFVVVVVVVVVAILVAPPPLGMVSSGEEGVGEGVGGWQRRRNGREGRRYIGNKLREGEEGNIMRGRCDNG